jgi:hypothetical protein
MKHVTGSPGRQDELLKARRVINSDPFRDAF